MAHPLDLNIRLVTLEDAPALLKLVKTNCERLSTYFPGMVSAIKDKESTCVFISEWLEKIARKEYFTFVMADKLPDQIVGALFVKSMDWKTLKCELGYFIDKDHEGKGMMTHSIARLIHYIFETMAFNKIYTRIAEDNIPSRRVVEKLGFRIEGILREDFKADSDQLLNMAYYGLLRSEWNLVSDTIQKN
jgi:ribosomal-protein-serine acetyltransferase